MSIDAQLLETTIHTNLPGLFLPIDKVPSGSSYQRVRVHHTELGDAWALTVQNTCRVLQVGLTAKGRDAGYNLRVHRQGDDFVIECYM